MSTTHQAREGRLARWRERRRTKRQQALEREYFEQERLNPTTRAYTGADNHARRWTSFLGGDEL